MALIGATDKGTGRSAPSSVSATALLTVYALTLLSFTWVMSNVPLIATPTADADDELFVRGAANLLSGRWLGPYDTLTLAKGPFYPLWIAFVWLTGLPLIAGQALAYGLAALLLVRALRPWLGGEILAMLLFLILLFNPATYAVGQLRVMREGIYVPLTIFIFALCAWWFRWRARPLLKRAALAIVLAVSVACFWCTREEGVWILPALAITALLLLLAPLTGSEGAIGTRLRAAQAPLLREGLLMLATVVIALLCVMGVGRINKAVYGVADVVELKQSEFLSAYGALARVNDPAGSKGYVVISRAEMEHVYAVSPAFAELRNYFDGPAGAGWAGFGCTAYKVDPCDGEIRAGWFVWALRYAASSAGHYGSAAASRAFFGQIAREIDTACSQGRLNCLGPRRTMAPPFERAFVQPTLRAAGRALKYLVAFDDMAVPHHPMSCMIDDCGKSGRRWPVFLDLVHASIFVPTPWIPFPEELTKRSEEAHPLPIQRLSDIVTHALDFVAPVYRSALVVAGPLALVGFAVLGLLSLMRRRTEPLFIAASVGAILIVTRIVLLAYLDATSFQAINSLYLSPVYPAVLFFVVTSVVGLARAIVAFSRRRTPRAAGP